MKDFFRAIIFLVIDLLFIACGQSVTATPSPIPSPSPTFTLTSTPIPSPTATATLEPTSMPEFVPPTLIPTIDPTRVPGLLSKVLSIQGVNGHDIRRITGWDYGFGTKAWWAYCPSSAWLDTNHLLLYPATGQESPPEGMWGGINVIPQPVVINLETESVWLPPVNLSSQRTCNRVYWSPELEILITSEVHNEASTVSIHTYDGDKISSYEGSVWGVSPSRTKIWIAEDTLLDLRTNERIHLDWPQNEDEEAVSSGLYWTDDETRVYRCCYYYADLVAGINHRFERSDFQDTSGNHLDPSGLWFYRGQWVRNDTYFLVEWSWIDDGDIRYLPLFDPATKIFYDVREMAGISPDWTSWKTRVSPDGSYIWMTGWEGSHLINLSTFEARYFPDLSYAEVDWSLDSKFVWVQVSDQTNDSTRFQILSVSDKAIRSIPVNPFPNSVHWWHPTDGVVAYPSADKNVLIFLDASTMSYRELPFTLQKPPHDNYRDVVWSPKGEKLAFLEEDGSVWQIDYPNLENLEQLTLSLPDVSDLNWSPDESSISFVSGSDIYIVETSK